MPSSWTSPYQLQKIQTGERVNVWGDDWNLNLDNIANMVGGIVSLPLTGDRVLTTDNLGSNEARYQVAHFTGGVGPFTVTFPSTPWAHHIWNATGGVVTVTTGAGATVQVGAGDIVQCFCDGANVKTLGFNGASLKAYIDSVIVGGPQSLPSLVGNAGKWLTNNGSTPSWALPTTSDLSDYTADQAARQAAATARAIAFAVAL